MDWVLKVSFASFSFEVLSMAKFHSSLLSLLAHVQLGWFSLLIPLENRKNLNFKKELDSWIMQYNNLHVNMILK